MSDEPTEAGPAAAEPVSLREATRVWAKIGLLSFGGPAGQVALMHSELVERRKWIDEERFLHALNYCMLLPGPEATQLATYIGWLMHKTRGGLIAGLLFVLPGFVSILALSMLYASFGDVPAIASMFFGLKAAVFAVVLEAVIRIGKRALKHRWMYGVAASAFVAIFFFDAPFPAVVLGAGMLGLVIRRVVPDAFPAPADPTITADHATVVDRLAAEGRLEHTKPNRARAVRVFVVWTVLWFAPLAIVAATLGRESVYVQEGIFFAKASVVTIGGAYSVLAYIAQRAVESYGWLRPGEMIDGLGLAETTPGPLIMVVQFVGYLGAFRDAGTLPPVLAGVLGSIMTVWVTFVPCFLWIFLGAPYVESLRGHRGLNAALSTITAAIVGVVVNLSVWFGLHVMFHTVHESHAGPLRLLVPVLSSVDVAAVGLSALAIVAMFRWKIELPKVLAASALLGFTIRFFG